MQTARILALVLLSVLSLAGCDHQLILGGAGPDEEVVTRGEQTAAGYVVVISSGKQTRILMYGRTQGGMETTGYGCDDDASLTASDPSVLDIQADGRNDEVTINSINHFRSKSYVLTALRVGTTTLTGVCEGTEATLQFRVEAARTP